MSSILEALKKLEQEKEEKDQDFDWPQPVNTQGALYGRLKRGSAYKPALAGFVLCLMLGASAYLLTHTYDSGKKEDQRTLPPVSASNSVEKADRAIAAIPAFSQEQPMATQEPDPVSTESQREPDPAPMEEDMMSDASADVAAMDTTGITPTREEIQDKTISSENPLAAMVEVKPDEAPAELDPEMAELLARIPADLLPPKKMVESGWLTLHAISWSDDPERRIAVINAQIVKEGRRLDGALIRRIERDYVVIEKNGEQLMLPFGNH